MTIYEEAKKYDYVSVDFDGVLMEHFLNKSWVRQMERNISMPTHHLALQFEILTVKLLNIIRKPLPGMKEGISKLHDEGKTIHLVSSRHVALSTATKKWLVKNGIADYFVEMEFNEEPTSAVDYKIMKYEEIRPDVHIDDNYETIEALAKKYPDKPFIYFDYTGKRRKFNLSNVTNTTEWI